MGDVKTWTPPDGRSWVIAVHGNKSSLVAVGDQVGDADPVYVVPEADYLAVVQERDRLRERVRTLEAKLSDAHCRADEYRDALLDDGRRSGGLR